MAGDKRQSQEAVKWSLISLLWPSSEWPAMAGGAKYISARDLRHEHPEQCQNREAVDETGCEAQQRRKRDWNRLRPWSKNLAHDIPRPRA
jgi:hypothetical protein